MINFHNDNIFIINLYLPTIHNQINIDKPPNIQKWKICIQIDYLFYKFTLQYFGYIFYCLQIIIFNYFIDEKEISKCAKP